MASLGLVIVLGIALARTDWAHALVKTNDDGRSLGAR